MGVAPARAGAGPIPSEKGDQAEPSATDRPLSDPEVQRARTILSQGQALVRGLFHDARLGKLVVTDDVASLVEDIARSVERSQASWGRYRRTERYSTMTGELRQGDPVQWAP